MDNTSGTSGGTSYPAVRNLTVAADPVVKTFDKVATELPGGEVQPAYPALSVMSAGYGLPGGASSRRGRPDFLDPECESQP